MAKSKKKKAAKKGSGNGAFAEFLRSDDFAKVRGVFYLIVALFMFVSIVAFFVTDQLGDPTAYDSNWCGTVGGAVAYFFVCKLFGLASAGLSFLLFLYGLRLMGKEPLPWWKTFGCTFFWMFWLASVFGYFSSAFAPDVAMDQFGEVIHPESKLQNFAGTVGFGIGSGMNSAIHFWTFVLLLFLGAAFLFVVHKVKFPSMEGLFQHKEKAPREPKVVEEKKGPSLISRMGTSLKEKLSRKEDDEESETEPEEPVRARKSALVDEPELIVDDPVKKEGPDVQDSMEGQIPLDIEPQMKPKAGPTTDVPFNIDDEFARINAKAQGTEPQPLEQVDPADEEDEERPEPHHYSVDELYDPHLDLRDFQMPSTDLLTDWERNNVKPTKEELVANKDKIVETLRNYGIEIVEITATPGPTVTLYEIKPAPGVRINKIKNLEDDIALSLSALGIRIIAPIPGKGSIGIEVPNANPQVVSMKTMLESDAFRNNTKYELPIALGKTISNEPYVTDLAKMPHLLMAGATGTGKSVGLNAVIASLLYKKHPADLKFVMVDPKKVELSLYSKIERHYLAKMPDADEAIITDVKKVVRTLNSLCIEMDQRYDLLKLAQVRKIKEYNDKFIHRRLNPESGHRYMPYIVLVIDEFADLIMTAGKEVETPIARLAQLARAVGIHLIIATQRPTTNIITGTIKANFPARIAFRVTSAIDSRTILDTGGANQLIGRGDMLISLAGADMVRLQCALIETEEIEKLAENIGEQRGYVDGFLLPEYLDENDEPTKDFDPHEKDEFFNDAARLVVASQFGSTSLLQRKLSLGYNRAGRIIDQLEAAGIVGPYAGSKAREVLIKDEVQLEEILKSL